MQLHQATLALNSGLCNHLFLLFAITSQ